MIGGLMKTTSRFAIAAAASFLVGGFALTPAKAADLGGDCCADLPQLVRVFVRKGIANLQRQIVMHHPQIG